MSTTVNQVNLCERIVASLHRNGYSSVRCEHDGEQHRLVGSVDSYSDRAVIYALAKTTVGGEDTLNSVEVAAKT